MLDILTHLAALAAGGGAVALRLRDGRSLRELAVAIVPALGPIWRPKA